MASSRYLQSPVAGDKLSGQEMGRKGELLNNWMIIAGQMPRSRDHLNILEKGRRKSELMSNQMMGRQTLVAGDKLNGLEKGRRNGDLRIIRMKICLAILLLASKPKDPEGGRRKQATMMNQMILPTLLRIPTFRYFPKQCTKLHYL